MFARVVRLIALLPLFTAILARAAAPLPFTFTTTAYDPSQVYLTFQTTFPDTFQATYVDTQTGTTTVNFGTTSGNRNHLSDAIQLSRIVGGVVNLTYADSALVYCSIGGKLNPAAAPNPGYPHDPAYTLTYQPIVEFTYTGVSGDNGDITNINFFSLQTGVQVFAQGHSDAVKTAGYTQSTGTILSQLEGLSSDPRVKVLSDPGPPEKVARILSPNSFGPTKDAQGNWYFDLAGYQDFKDYVQSVQNANPPVQTLIQGNVAGLDFNFVSVVNGAGDIVTTGTYTGSTATYTVTIPHDYDMTDGSGLRNYIQSSALYLCSTSETSDLAPTGIYVTSSDNSAINVPVLAQVCHDITTGYNYGFVNSQVQDPVTHQPFGQEPSNLWWSNATPTQIFAGLQPDVSGRASFYNRYAKVISDTSARSVYGFPYADALISGQVTLDTVDTPDPVTGLPIPVTGWTITIGANDSSTEGNGGSGGATGHLRQAIVLGLIPNQAFTTKPIVLRALSTAGLPVTYTVAGPATISGNKLTFTGVGQVTLRAAQSGNARFAPAPTVTRTFNVLKARQAIRFLAVREQTVGSTISLQATASSGLPVTYSLIYGAATLNGNQLTFNKVGAVTIQADQPGDDHFYAAPSVRESILVVKPLPRRIR